MLRISPEKFHKLVQNLSNVEKKTLIWWITQLIIDRFLISSKLMLEMAEKFH